MKIGAANHGKLVFHNFFCFCIVVYLSRLVMFLVFDLIFLYLCFVFVFFSGSLSVGKWLSDKRRIKIQELITKYKMKMEQENNNGQNQTPHE